VFDALAFPRLGHQRTRDEGPERHGIAGIKRQQRAAEAEPETHHA
jgi:hypothetical protein